MAPTAAGHAKYFVAITSIPQPLDEYRSEFELLYKRPSSFHASIYFTMGSLAAGHIVTIMPRRRAAYGALSSTLNINGWGYFLGNGLLALMPLGVSRRASSY